MTRQQTTDSRRALVAAVVAIVGGVGMLHETLGRLEGHDGDRAVEVQQLRVDVGDLRKQLSNCPRPK